MLWYVSYFLQFCDHKERSDYSTYNSDFHNTKIWWMKLFCITHHLVLVRCYMCRLCYRWNV